MNKILHFAQLLTLASITVLCVVATLLFMDLKHTVAAASKDEAKVVANLNQSLTSLNGDLGEFHKVLYTSNVSAAEVGRAAIAERFYAEKQLPATLAKANTVLDNTSAVLLSLEKTSDSLRGNGETITASVQTTLGATTSTIEGLKPVEANAAQATAALKELIADPDFKATAHNLSVTSASAAVTAQQIQGTTKDVEHVVHAWAYPTPLQRVVQWIGIAASGAGSYLAGKIF